MNEEFISNQIAVYKNSKTLVELQDKLKVAGMCSYAHIHADGEPGEDGRKMHSLIGILMKDYSNGTGDKAVTVTAKIHLIAFDYRLSGIQLPAGQNLWSERQQRLCKGIQSTHHTRSEGQQRSRKKASVVYRSRKRKRNPSAKCQWRYLHESQFLYQ